jgi:hypothetical protein
MAAREEAAMPLPSEDTTPPVIKMYFVIIVFEVLEGRIDTCILIDIKGAVQTR